jgi:hypothetical protein
MPSFVKENNDQRSNIVRSDRWSKICQCQGDHSLMDCRKESVGLTKQKEQLQLCFISARVGL